MNTPPFLIHQKEEAGDGHERTEPEAAGRADGGKRRGGAGAGVRAEAMGVADAGRGSGGRDGAGVRGADAGGDGGVRRAAGGGEPPVRPGPHGGGRRLGSVRRAADGALAGVFSVGAVFSFVPLDRPLFGRRAHPARPAFVFAVHFPERRVQRVRRVLLRPGTRPAPRRERAGGTKCA